MKPEMAPLTFLKTDRPSRSNVMAVSSEEMPELPFCTAPAAVVLAALAVLWAVAAAVLAELAVEFAVLAVVCALSAAALAPFAAFAAPFAVVCAAPALPFAASAVRWAVVTLTDRPSAVCLSSDVLA